MSHRCRKTKDCKHERKRERKREHKKCPKTEKHDYVIVGGGTAGLTLGYLLNKDGFDVVVLEAGEDQDLNPKIFEFQTVGSLETSERNQFFWLENEEGTRTNTNHYSGGRIQGGGTSVNSAIYIRGNTKDYVKWGGVFANENYVTKAFNSFETFVGVTQGDRGTSGPATIFQQTEVDPIAIKMADGIQGAYLANFGINVPIVDDFNAENKPAISPASQGWMNPDTLTRVSTSTAFIKKTQSDLPIKTKSTITKILFKCNKAVGVEYVQNGVCKTICARKKVIVCAGPRSSAVLQKSGVGDAAYLTSLGIPVVIDNPQVGQNLFNQRELFFEITCNPNDNIGISSTVIGTQGNSFQNFAGWNNLPDTKVGSDPLESAWGINTLNLLGPGKSFAFGLYNVPKSRGEVNILSSDPLHPINPILDVFEDPEDIAGMVRLLEAMAKTIEYIHDNIDPAYTIVSDISNPVEFVKANTDHPHQWAGQCRIGDVVDSNLQVMGAEHLMVADLSVAISPHSGGTSAPATMIGVAAYTIITGNFDPQF